MATTSISSCRVPREVEQPQKARKAHPICNTTACYKVSQPLLVVDPEATKDTPLERLGRPSGLSLTLFDGRALQAVRMFVLKVGEKGDK